MLLDKVNIIAMNDGDRNKIIMNIQKMSQNLILEDTEEEIQAD